MSRRMYTDEEIIELAQKHGGKVKSVNGKIGDVVLKAEDIEVKNSQSIQDNLERIDESVEDLVDTTGNLEERIDNMSNIGRFLSMWNATTGLPETNPTTELPYEYHTGDYYRVSVAGNYAPYGDEYDGTASTHTIAGGLAIQDILYYDGTNWIKQISGGAGTITDVKVNNESVVSGGVANISLPFQDFQVEMSDGTTKTMRFYCTDVIQ